MIIGPRLVFACKVRRIAPTDSLSSFAGATGAVAGAARGRSTGGASAARRFSATNGSTKGSSRAAEALTAVSANDGARGRLRSTGLDSVSRFELRGANNLESSVVGSFGRGGSTFLAGC